MGSIFERSLGVCGVYAVIGLAILAGCQTAVKPSEATVVSFSDYSRDVIPWMTRYCYACHSQKAQVEKGGIGFDSYITLEDVKADPTTWKDVVIALRKGEMPPRGKLQPPLAERQAMCQWIEAQFPKGNE